MENNSASLTRIPGVGKKTAERLLVEMRDRLQTWAREEQPSGKDTLSVGAGLVNVIHEAVGALIALGYKPQEASKAVSRVNLPNASCEELIRAALQGMA